MAEKGGGSSTAIGIDYQSWFTAYKLVEILLGEIDALKAEATFLTDPTEEKKIDIEYGYVDDLVVFSGNKRYYYNLKHNTSDHTNWTFLRLKKEGVIEQFKKQFKNSPDAFLIFVSHASSPIFSKVLDSIKNLLSEKEVETKLGKESLKDWKSLKTELKFSFSKMVSFANQVSSEHISEGELKKRIKRNLKPIVADPEYASLVIHEFAQTIIKKPRVIDKKSLLDWLEEKKIFITSQKTRDKILKDFERYSVVLENWKSGFGAMEYLPRKEIEQIESWIKESKENTCSLTGNAGTGKTVILEKLFISLKNEGIPILGLKCDEQDRLLNEQKISEIISSIAKITAKNDMVVIMDQIKYNTPYKLDQ